MDGPYDKRMEAIKSDPTQFAIYKKYTKANDRERAENFNFYLRNKVYFIEEVKGGKKQTNQLNTIPHKKKGLLHNLFSSAR